MSEPASQSLPRRIIVSLKAGGIFFAIANVICVALIAYAYMSVRHQPKTIEVKGSAKRAIESDLVSWTCQLTARDPDLIKAYDKLKADADKVAAFLKSAGIPAQEAKFSAISTQKIFAREVISGGKARQVGGDAVADSGNGGGTGGNAVVVQTQKVEMYVLVQSIIVESDDTSKVPEASRTVTKLIKDGVEIESQEPRFFYTKLSALKIDMLAEATKDATKRAEQVVGNANGKLGRLVEAKMGVMQINPKNVTDVSDTGNNDTTSLEKEITAIVTARFEVN